MKLRVLASGITASSHENVRAAESRVALRPHSQRAIWLSTGGAASGARAGSCACTASTWRMMVSATAFARPVGTLIFGSSSTSSAPSRCTSIRSASHPHVQHCGTRRSLWAERRRVDHISARSRRAMLCSNTLTIAMLLRSTCRSSVFAPHRPQHRPCARGRRERCARDHRAEIRAGTAPACSVARQTSSPSGGNGRPPRTAACTGATA